MSVAPQEVVATATSEDPLVVADSGMWKCYAVPSRR